MSYDLKKKNIILTDDGMFIRLAAYIHPDQTNAAYKAARSSFFFILKIGCFTT